MRKLEELIREAKQAAERLEAALAAAGDANPAPAKPTIPQSPPDAEEPSWEPISQAEALGRAGLDLSQTLVRRDEPSSEPRPPVATRYQEIYALADEGLDAAEIASRLSSPVGEVQLILGLRRAR
jgi:hypothetical protein